MTLISKTRLATSDPASMLESQGAIPYEAGDDGLDNGVLSFTLKGHVTKYVIFGAFKIVTTIKLPIDIGFGKTCWGADMQALIEVDDSDPDSAVLTVADDTFTAGKVIGMDLNPEFDFDIYHIHYHWLHHHSWDLKWSFSKGPYRFDVLAVLSDIVGKLITLGDIIPLGDIIAALLPQNVDTGSYYDKTSGIAAGEGAISLDPKVVGDVDLVSFFLTIGEDLLRAIFLPTGSLELVVELVLALGDVVLTLHEFVNPTLAFGPSFGLASPVDINITDFSVADSTFEVSHGDGTSLYGKGDGNDALPADVSSEDVSISLHASSSYDILAGGFIQVTWLKVLSIEKRKMSTILKQERATRDSVFYNLVGAQDLDNASVDKGELEEDLN